MRCLLLLLALLLPASPALAWGEYGHRTVAAIALANTTPATRREVRRLLTHRAELRTPDCPLTTLGDASVWADCIRRDRERFDYTAPWHYQNVDICQPFDLDSPCANGSCVKGAIDRSFAVLKDERLADWERLQALAFLTHFTGDLAMPLHAGDRGDRGGNDVAVAWGIYAPDWLNLHGVWDGIIAERALTTGPSVVRRYSAEERAVASAGTTEDWSRQSWELSRAIAYTRALDGDPCGPKPDGRLTLDEADAAAVLPVAREQIVRAGLRLARMLDEALGSSRLGN